MANSKRTLSASGIKYLLAIYRLNRRNGKVRNVDIAEELGITKPSVHAMVKMLVDMELLKKDHYGAVSFTEDGRLTAERYMKYHNIVCAMLADHLSCSDDVSSAACALIAELSQESLETMCEKQV